MTDRPESPHLRGLRLKGVLEYRASMMRDFGDDMHTMIRLKADDTPLYLSQECQRNLRDARKRIDGLLAMAEEKEKI